MSYVYVCVSNDLAESQKPPGLLSIGADEGVRIHILSGRACKTYVKLMWNIDFYAGGTYVMRMWSVCAAQVKTYVSRMWNICKTYAKYMWHLGLDCVVFMFYLCIRLRIYVFFYVGGKIRPYFVQITQNKALFWNARIENNKQNANENANTFCNVSVCTCVYGLCFIYVGRKIRPYFGQIRPYFIAYAKETQTET